MLDYLILVNIKIIQYKKACLKNFLLKFFGFQLYVGVIRLNKKYLMLQKAFQNYIGLFKRNRVKILEQT